MHYPKLREEIQEEPFSFLHEVDKAPEHTKDLLMSETPSLNTRTQLPHPPCAHTCMVHAC